MAHATTDDESSLVDHPPRPMRLTEKRTTRSARELCDANGRDDAMTNRADANRNTFLEIIMHGLLFKVFCSFSSRWFSSPVWSFLTSRRCPSTPMLYVRPDGVVVG